MHKTKMKIPRNEMIFTDDTEIQLQQNEDGVESFSMLAYSGKPIKGRAFWGGDLAIDVQGIEFAGKRFPILEQHELEKKIGVSNSRPSIKDHQIVFDKINLLKNETAQEFKSNLNDGFPYQASIGIRPLVIEELAENASAEVNGYKIKGPGAIIRKSTFREASVCVFGADPNTNVSFSDEQETIDVELIKDETNHETEEYSMTVAELKEKHPDLVKQIVDEAVAPKDEGLSNLNAQFESLRGEKSELEAKLAEKDAQITELTKLENQRKAQEVQNQAEAIVDAKLSEHKIPAEMHKKVKKQISHLDFISDDSTLDTAKFTEAVEVEVKDWAETLGKFVESADHKVMGFGGNDRENFSDEGVDEDVDRLFKYVQVQK